MFNSGEKDSTRDLLQMEAITRAVIKWKNNIIMSSHKDMKSCLSKANIWLVKLACAAAGSFLAGRMRSLKHMAKHPGVLQLYRLETGHPNWTSWRGMHRHPKATGHLHEPEPGGSALHIPNIPSGYLGYNIPWVDSGTGCLSKPNLLSPAPAVAHWGCWPQFFG